MGHFPDPVVRQMIALDLALVEHYDEQLRVLEQDLAMKAKAHDAYAYHLARARCRGSAEYSPW